MCQRYGLGKNFFPKPLEIEVFPPAHNGVRFFLPALYNMRDFGISLQDFYPLKISMHDITHRPPPPTQKSNGRPTPNIPGIGIQNIIEVQKKTFSLLLDVNRSTQKTFKVRKSLVSQNSFLPPPFIFKWSLPYGPMRDLHQQTVKREKEWGGGVGTNERE